MNPRRKSSQLLEIAALIMIAVSLYPFFRGAFFGFIADSEIWTVTLSRLLPDVGNEISIYYKIVFHGFIKLADVLSSTNIETFVFTRLLFTLVALGSLYLTFKICYQVSRCRLTAFFALILLLCSTLFMVRGYRIRSDLLAGFIHLLNVSYIIFLYKKEKLSIAREVLISSGLLILMLLATPKAIYFTIAQFVLFACLFASLKEKRRTTFFRIGFYTYLGLPLLTIVLSFAGELIYSIGLISTSPSFIYYKAYEFFYRTFNPDYGSPGYLSWVSFSYLALFVKRNPVLIALIYLGFYFPFVKILLKKTALLPKTLKMAFFYYSLVIAISTLLHNDKLPFFICSMLPPMVITGALSIGHIAKILSSFTSKNQSFIFYSLKSNLMILFTVIIAFNTYNYLTKVNSNSNELQFVTIRYLEDYLGAVGNPNYYDVIGTLPKDNSIYAFVGPGETASLYWVKQKLINQSPDLIFYSNKMYLLEPFLTQRFLKFSAPLGHGVFGHSPIYSKSADKELFPNTKNIQNEVYRVFELDRLSLIIKAFYSKNLLENNSLSIFKSKRAIHPSINQEFPIYVEWKNGIIEPLNPYTQFSWLQDHAHSVLIYDNYEINYFSLYPILDLPFKNPPFFMNLFRFDINI